METMGDARTPLLQGTLDLLILKCLSLSEMHGLAIARRIAQITKGAYDVKPGSLFPALHRLEERGWLVSSWGESENNRRAKYYGLTTAGRRQLPREMDEWKRIAAAMSFALHTT
jgi:PadR family transcriptional regulator PadR